MLIISKDITIRNATAEDAQILCDWWNDGDIMEHAGYPNGLGTTVEDVRSKLETDTEATYRRLMIEYKNQLIGEMNYKNMGSDVAGIGIKICKPDMRERGLGTQSLRLLINSLFSEYGYKQIVLDTDLENERAQHVYEKLGFKKVRVNQNKFKNQIGEFRSSVDYELRRKEF